VAPTGVAYSRSGELAICDDEAHHVIIMSKYMSLIRRVALPFSNPNVVMPSSRPQQSTAAMTHDSRSLALSPALSPMARKLKAQHDFALLHDGKNAKWMSSSIRANASKPAPPDIHVTTVAFAPDGSIAVGYKMGGKQK
jgi:hypothetical protein